MSAQGQQASLAGIIPHRSNGCAPMTQDRLISELCERLRAVWHADASRCEETVDGFDWWPGDQRVSVRVARSDDPVDRSGVRLSVTTEFLTGIDWSAEEAIDVVRHLGLMAPCYSVRHLSNEVAERLGAGDDAVSSVSFVSTIYIREQTMAWLPELFARLAMVTICDAHHRAAKAAELTQATASRSAPGGGEASGHTDKILDVVEALFLPAGEGTSRWAGSDEFKELTDNYGSNDICYGDGDDKGATLETVFANDTAIVELRSAERHPMMGAGLLVGLQLPFFGKFDEIAAFCERIGHVQASSYTGAPLLGTWLPKEVQPELYCPANACFVPNLLYKRGLATNLALWQLTQARWARSTFWPDACDDSITAIMERRFSAA